nr:GFA family protein [Pararhizobium haloflavum]
MRYTVSGPLRAIIACHCIECRKQSGHFFAATAAADSDLVVTGEKHITWYAASNVAQRGFCRHCGSALFWKRQASTTTSILAGSLDGKTEMTIARHIFCGEKGDYYDIADGVAQSVGNG